jgi:hypothetical protein
MLLRYPQHDYFDIDVACQCPPRQLHHLRPKVVNCHWHLD